MQYTLLIHETDDGFSARTDPARQADYWSGTMHYLRALKEAGVWLGGAGLMPPPSATTLKRQDGKLVVEDGPFATTKEQLGGYFIIEVADQDAAIQWASRFPARPDVVVEVRPNLPSE